MKIIYAAYRHDPLDPDLGSGVDHGLFTSVQAAGAEMQIVGPFRNPATLAERGLGQAYRRIARKRWCRLHPSLVLRASHSLNNAVLETEADVVLTMFPTSLAFYNGSIPVVYVVDSTYSAANRDYPGYGLGRIPGRVDAWVQKRAFERSTHFVTHSEWCKKEMMREYKIPAEAITVLAMPAAIPEHLVPNAADVLEAKVLELPLRLLLVGRPPHRKGLDVAVKIVEGLNAAGTPAELTVCASDAGQSTYLRSVGPFRKGSPEQLSQYLSLYHRAHLLLHPARFEPAGIVPGEAAAFGTPTITNDVGGLATTVQDGVSGIVLPGHSPAEAYVRAISELIYTPGRYAALCRSSRERYERELNWSVVGGRVLTLLSRFREHGSQNSALRCV